MTNLNLIEHNLKIALSQYIDACPPGNPALRPAITFAFSFTDGHTITHYARDNQIATAYLDKVIRGLTQGTAARQTLADLRTAAKQSIPPSANWQAFTPDLCGLGAFLTDRTIQTSESDQ